MRAYNMHALNQAETEMPMWQMEHEHPTTAAPEVIFGLWADVHGWPSWDTSLIATTLDGAFEAGAAGTLHPEGAPESLPFVVTSVDPGRGFSDETHLGPTVLRFIHRLDGGERDLRVVVRVEVEGSDAAQIGAMVTADLADSVASLVATAESASH